MSLLDNNIYSPKKGIARIHSQENIYYNDNNNNKKIKNNEKINFLWKNKNKSLKDLTGFTYKKKNSSYILQKKDKTYNIKPDIYPEIKINLKSRIKPLNKNNSVIYESKHKSDLNCVYKKNKIKRYDSESCSRTTKLKNIKENNTVCNKNDIEEKETISCFISNTELNYIILLIEKIKDIFDSLILNDDYLILKYCFEFINYIYNYNIDNYISNSIINIIDIETRKILNNYFIFAIVVIYDLILKEKKLFNNLKILVKESIKLIYSNIIIIINYSKDNIISSKNIFLNTIINNINIQYKKNKDLYIDDNEYLLLKQNNNSIISPEDKLNYNLNFIIKNIHTIINNMKKSSDYKLFIQIFQQMNNISLENIYDFFINNIYQINIINSTLAVASKLFLTNNNDINKIILNKKKYTLLISLDGTLIHFKIDNKNKNNNKGIIQLRPGLNEFLSDIKPYYEIIAFSNGDKKYTDLLINSLDKNKIFFENKLYREHCIIMNNDFVKDISKLGKDLSKIIIVDNLVQNYRLNLENGINIKSFNGEINDKILKELGKILIKIAKFGGDIRRGISYYKDDIINKVSSNIYCYYYK
jgi:Dullard-like phosphatase family protein